MKFRQFLPALAAVAAGGVGFVLRRWQLTTGFDPATGLALGSAPANLALIGWSLAAALLFALLARRRARIPESGEMVGARQNTLYLTLVLLSAVLLLVSAGFEVLQHSVNSQAAQVSDYLLVQAAAAALPPLRIVLCVGGLFCAGLWARSLFRGSGDRVESLPLLELCLLFCVWLISDYQGRAADPVILDYAYEVFAISAALMGLYYLAGWSFHEPHPGRTLFFLLLGVYFCMVTMADSHTPADLFRYGFAVLFLAAHALFLFESPHPGSQPEANRTEAQKNG